MAWSHSEEQESLCPPPLPAAGKLESSPLWTLHLRGGWKPAEQLQAPGSVQTTEPALPQASPGGTIGLRRRGPTECQSSRQEPCYVAPGHLVLVPAAHQVAAQGGPYKPRVAVRKVTQLQHVFLAVQPKARYCLLPLCAKPKLWSGQLGDTP